MREIKFRFWLGTTKKMSYAHSLFDIQEVFQDRIIDDATPMQYTGIKDKNGKDIYEGDIYHMGDTNITYTVVWHDCGLIGKQNTSSSYAGVQHWKYNIKVIGNIYENPELLK